MLCIKWYKICRMVINLICIVLPFSSKLIKKIVYVPHDGEVNLFSRQPYTLYTILYLHKNIQHFVLGFSSNIYYS